MNETGDTRSAPAAALDRSALPSPYIQWGPTFGGGLVAAAVFFVLVSFATAIGLAVSSVSPTWRDTSVGLVVLSGAWVVLTAVGSFALGGYIAGRIRSTWRTNPDEVHFRDGLHGLVVWSVAVIIGVGLTWGSAATINASTSKSSLVNPASSTTNTSDLEPSFLTFELDRLFWSDNRQQATDAQTRAQAGRILERGLGKKELARGRPPFRATPLPASCRLLPLNAFDQTNRRWLLTARQPRASASAAIPETPAWDGMLSTTWQLLQSKVCNVDSSLNLNCMGRPQKGQRGRGTSTSMRLT